LVRLTIAAASITPTYVETAMAHSFTSSLFHCVFSTKERVKIITPDLQVRLWPYMGGIAREHDMKALAIGGIEDHVHLLLSLPSTLAIAKAIQLIKGNSSKWVHDTFPQFVDFAWQEGYGAFSIGVSGIEATTAYIQDQQEHHRRKSFQEEFLSFLHKHNIEYDPRFVWG
jgi:putative transposase